MTDLVLRADAWFDGLRYHPEAVTVLVQAGAVQAVLPGRPAVGGGAPEVAAGFLAPGLVEGHCHLFLDGAELDLAKRTAHLSAGEEAWLATGRGNLQRLRAQGVTLVRDAGDRWGINHRLRAEAAPGSGLPRVRSPGKAIRRKGRYGQFMADEVEDEAGCRAAVQARAGVGADDCKIVLTGIIDFAAAAVKGAPQFDAVMLKAMVEEAQAAGLPTFAHCSGRDGLQLAVDAGVGSVEHGFFIDEAILARMAERGTAWCPTWSPVGFVAEQPALFGVGEAGLAGIRSILANHRQCLLRAHQLGVAIVVGSDAGSCGVDHGRAVVDEMLRLQEAGLPLEAVLAAATSAPRCAWGLGEGRLCAGAPADLALWERSPADGLERLRQARATVVAGALWESESPVLAA